MIKRIVRGSMFFLVVVFSLNGNAQDFNLVGPSVLSELPINIVSAMELGSVVVTNPDQLGALLAVATDTVAGVSPIFDKLLTGGVLVLPGAFIDGDTLLSPSVTLLPGIWVVNKPLPGL